MDALPCGGTDGEDAFSVHLRLTTRRASVNVQQTLGKSAVFWPVREPSERESPAKEW